MAGAPPRPGTAKYEEMMKERERERQTPKKDAPRNYRITRWAKFTDGCLA
jgi:hypothetical protein